MNAAATLSRSAAAGAGLVVAAELDAVAARMEKERGVDRAAWESDATG